MRLFRYVLPFTVLLSACAPAVSPLVRESDSHPRVSLLGSSLTITLAGGLTTQALPAIWDEAQIRVESYNLKHPLDSGILPAGPGPISHTFNVPPGPVTIQVDLRQSGQVVASGSSHTVILAGPNIVPIELSTLLPTLVTFAGGIAEGNIDGLGLEATFSRPRGLALDDQGNLYVADYGNARIRKVAPDGQVTTLAGSEPGYLDGSGWDAGAPGTARFEGPTGLAFDPATRRLYVSDSIRHVIRVIDLNKSPTDQDFVSTMAGSGQPGYLDGTGAEVQFNTPQGISMYFSDLLVADTMNHKIRRVSPYRTVDTMAGFAGPGFADGPVQTAGFNAPSGVAGDLSGNIYVADTGSHRIRRIAGDVVSTVAGGPEAGMAVGSGGDAGTSRLNNPVSIIWGGSGYWLGSLFVLETGNSRIVRLDLGQQPESGGFVSEFMGGPDPGFADGSPAGARFVFPFGMAVQPVPTPVETEATYFYVADSENHRIVRGIFAGVGPVAP